ncbi:karyopherin alpha3 [Dermatophagoides farinae]|uniref:Importin subunit alpha n=1 Tax=Dermatophagoides farinae TaxID=6954 RepID=A0A9D4P8A5_DERFA|nr:importin subunit alpha-3-like [Dermatophagoides farinae]KAH7645902.1 importin subunit alpha-4-like protein [Dermatophagoides farinae]
MDQHSRGYKNRGSDIDDVRRRRNEATVELRKNKREDALLKKRNITITNDCQDSSNVDGVIEPKLVLEDLNSLVIASMSPDPDDKLTAIKNARMLLSSDKNPPIDEIIAAGILPPLIDALKYSNVPTLQFEAAWALTNIASGTSIQTRKVVDEGAVPLLVNLLVSPNENVAEQSLWALGNIIGDGPDLRDFVIESGVLEPLITILHRYPSPSFLRNLSWVIINMCRNKNPPLPITVLVTILPVLQSLLQHSQDTSILVDVVWAISYITDHGNEQIQMVIDSGLVSFIIPLLHHEDLKIQTPALRVIGNIVTGTDDQTQFVLDSNVLAYLPPLLNHTKEKIKKEALWFLSNITAGRIDQIQTLMDHNIIPTIIENLDRGSFQLQREAAWAISNMTMNGTKEQVRYLVEQGVIEPMCKLLTVKDTQILQILLEGLIKIFHHYETQVNVIADEIEKCGGLDTIESLQHHENDQIYKFAFEIVDRFFDSNTEDIPELVPQANDTEFGFNNNNNENVPNHQNQQQFNF